MKLRRETSAETATRFRASYERRADAAMTDPARRRQLGAIMAACRRMGRPIPQWVRFALFAKKRGRTARSRA